MRERFAEKQCRTIKINEKDKSWLNYLDEFPLDRDFSRIGSDKSFPLIPKFTTFTAMSRG